MPQKDDSMSGGDNRAALADSMARNKQTHREALSGFRAELVYPDERRVVFTAGSHEPEIERNTEHEGFRDVMGEVEAASGHRFHAIIRLCVPDSREHYGSTLFALDGEGGWGLYEQSTPEFDAWVEKMESMCPDFEMFPYRYRYLDEDLRERDHHVGADGWSGG